MQERCGGHFPCSAELLCELLSLRGTLSELLCTLSKHRLGCLEGMDAIVAFMVIYFIIVISSSSSIPCALCNNATLQYCV